MSPPPTPLPAPPSEARPIDASERLDLLDVLRGFALCGVFVSNVFGWFSGRAYMQRAQLEAAMASASWLDTAAVYVSGTLVSGKFITLFSFLFGLGFSVQMIRAEARGAAIAPLYMRRLCVMFLIGAAHLFGLWLGDILTTYAVLGFALLLFRKRADKTLLIWAAVLIFAMPLVTNVLMKVVPMLVNGGGAEGAAEAAKAAMERSNQARAQTLEAFTHGTYFEVVRANARYYLGHFIQGMLPVLFALLGRFLLGFMAGRRRLFHDAPQHLGFFRKLLEWSLVLGAIGSAAGLVLQYMMRQKMIDPQAQWLVLMTPVRQLNEVGLAAVYVSGLVLLFQRETWRRLLLVLAPVGRMALTNYLGETVISLFVYYGFGLGLMGKLGPTASIGLTLAIFCVQVAFSHWWLARFRFGPAEWVWRSLTYGKAQPMRRTGAPEVATATAA
ncbi:DUF418 domain-containing protein [Archangium violaceum]|uniref:DUF418 domain-containing protein n=1 Tax=Archangium violaceum TaxID=83451 RepID=UPI00193C1EE0|nr:DUF418 domain-containing protein [Archangium violaceum]QRK12721.1 DUF418 domain-containing protein [Archangium violaceum]